ncbi:hypothetical protein Y838_01350 [Listeria monocytogenes]|uniref:Uncharacterized protein n=1 Tax=Listeria monocytogenes TaxID=1639 RepID=A0A7V0BHZ9_LISMN|nr:MULTISPECIES: hypothetical protein [Listeria]EAH4128657.1 hypothetical protein [Listeria monocytogenes LIS0077]EKE4565875.1 hypothetical protein [Listeria monocytogenes serotype 1/2a]AKI40136.1 putative phage protein [Listeria monocytogenes]AKI43544.1 putative phage protein [Listeria monocytogenes]EAA0067678.1 hypothetical protein [Listeria monocytogenes]
MEAEKQTGFVTRLELLEYESKLKIDVSKDIEKIENKVDGLGDDLNDLKDIVIPLSLSLDQIAKNTERTATTLDRFASDTTIHLHEHDIELTSIKAKSEKADKVKNSDAMVTVAIIGLIGAVITTIITLAPIMWK